MAREMSKLYSEMSVDEQTRYVTDLTTFVNEKLPVLEQLGDAWEMSSRKDMETGLYLLSAFQYARDFVNKALMYGDYKARAGRIRVYVDKIKKELSTGMTITGSDGKTYAYVPPSGPLRRRGRPTKEETAARMNGITVVTNEDTPEVKRRKVIAKLLGLEVIVKGGPQREKNNAELKAERDAREAERAKREPSLFGGKTAERGDGGGSDGKIPDADATGTVAAPSPCAQLMSDSYEMRMAQDKLHLNQLAWMLSGELAKRVETIQGLRVTSESASERAKLLAEQGAAPETIEPYAQQAKEATEAYLAIYQAVDDELAVLHRRITLDQPYVEKFKARFKGVDMERVLHITRPYYEKMKSPELEVRVQTIIQQENPEYAAQMKKEEAEKKEVSELVRYITRKDKGPSDERCRTLAIRINRLRELRGDEFANAYLPILEKTKEENAKMKAEKETKQKDTDPTPNPSPAMGGESGGDNERKSTDGEAKPKKAAKKTAAKKPASDKAGVEAEKTAKK